jgi:predicted ribosome quality control (RQC) complex YloA/Tae2 family protein
MDDQTIKDIVAEIAPLLEGRTPGKLFQLAPFTMAIDFRSRDKSYLLISAEPNQPRLHMMARRVTELEKRSLPLSPFALALKSELGHIQLRSITKDSHDRIVRFSFRGEDELGQRVARTFIAQLTGRAANLFLLDDQENIVRALRPGRGAGQAVGQKYEAPQDATDTGHRRQTTPLEKGDCKTFSEAADAHYRQREAAHASDARAATARNDLRKQITQQQKLLKTLERDLATHADAEAHKRMGDLLLANISNANRRGNEVEVIDYFTDGSPVITVQVDADASLSEEAARSFARYAKSKRARQEIAKRIGLVKIELEKLLARQTELEQVISGGNEEALALFIGSKKSVAPAGAGGSSSRKTAQKIPGVRRYLSSDGYEILVGRAARDNDHLTFRIAKPHDLWLHSADYPGSHVVVRNPARKEIPHRTLVEAAQLAAYFCQARKDAKVPVHYTQRKFLAKPKGAAPGLVRMSSFKNINVEPKESGERI